MTAFAYIGSWGVVGHGTPPKEHGFFLASHDASTGRLAAIGPATPAFCVGDTCLDPRRRILYATNEVATHDGGLEGGCGEIRAYALDPASGAMTEIDRVCSYGPLPSYVALDATGHYLLVTHHTTDVVTTHLARRPDGAHEISIAHDDAPTVLLALRRDGTIDPEPRDVVVHTAPPGPLRQQTWPQMHCVVPSPSGSIFVLCNKGCDRVVTMKLDYDAERLVLCNGEGRETAPGSCPRYAVFHPTLPYVFVNHEHRAVVSAYRYDEQGGLDALGDVSCLPDGVEDRRPIMQSDLLIHPNGRYLYDLIRGLDAVTVMRIDQQTGRLERTQTVALGAAGPRGCALTADGAFLHVAALAGGEVRTLAVAPDGTLSSTEMSIAVALAGNVTLFEPDDGAGSGPSPCAAMDV